MKVIVEYSQSSLKQGAEQVSEFVNQLVTDNSNVQWAEIAVLAENRQADELLNMGNLKEAYRFILKMKRPDFLINLSIRLLQSLFDSRSRP